MARHSASAAVVAVDQASSQPLYRQVAESLRQGIVVGKLRSGTRLPSTRALAETLCLSRNTISLAYQELLAQGYLEARIGSGTYISESLPAKLLTVLDAVPDDETGVTQPRISRRGHRMASLPVSEVRQDGPPRPFRAGVPAIDSFAAEEWLRLSSSLWRSDTRVLMSYGDPRGHSELRIAIADMLAATRAVQVTPEQVIVVSGSQQGLHLIATVLMDEGDEIWLEDPVRTVARSVFLAAGLRIVPIALDAEGLRVDQGRRRAPTAAAAYVSPSSPFPTGVHMGVGRRLELLTWARETGAWIIEDDYDSEYRYAGRPLPALQGLDRGGRVIYSGTFSHSLFPALRLGYLVVPDRVSEAFARARALVDRQSPSWVQATLARFIQDGHFDRHVRRMRRRYAARQEALVDGAARYLSDLLEVRPAPSGLHLLGLLPEAVDDLLAEDSAYAHGVDCTALSRFAIEAKPPSALVLGYGVGSEGEIVAACRRLADALHGLHRSGETRHGQKWTH